MKNQEVVKIRILILVLVVCIGGVILFFVVNNNNNNNENNNNNNNNNNTQTQDPNKDYEDGKESTDMQGSENVKVESGKVTNTSKKLKETKNYKDCSINVTEVVTENGMTKITLTVKNNTNEDKNLDVANIEIVNDKGEVFKKVTAYFGSIKKQDSKTVTISTQIDVANMYDLKIK